MGRSTLKACATTLALAIATASAGPAVRAEVTRSALPRLPVDEGVQHLRAGTIDFDVSALRADYAARPGFTADEWWDRKDVYVALREKRWKDAVRVAGERLATHPIETEAWLLRAAAERELGDLPAAERDHRAGAALIQAIAASGDGLSAATAWVVIGVGEEYAFLASQDLSSGAQSLNHQDGHNYDILEVTMPDGSHGRRWFNIDRVFGHEL